MVELIIIVSLILIFAGCMVYISVRCYKKLLNPIVLLVGPFAMACLCAALRNGSTSKEVLTNGLIWIFLALGIFCFCFLLASQFSIRLGRNQLLCCRDVVYNKRMVERLTTLCCVVISIELLVVTYTVLEIAGSLSVLFTNGTWVRIQYLERSGSLAQALLGWILSVNSFLFSCLLPVGIQMKCRHAKIKLIFAVMGRLAVSVISMSKESFIVYGVILIVAFSQSFDTGKDELKFLTKNAKWVVIAFVVLLFVIAVQRNYLAQRYSSYVEAVIGTVVEYAAIPIWSFSLLLAQQGYTFSGGQSCFRPIVNILAYLGIGEKTSIIHEPIEGAANVFTMFGNMYEDFGLSGILLLSALFGILLGALFSPNPNKRLDRMTINAMIGMVMFMGFFHFMLMQTIYYFVILYAWAFCGIFARKLYQQKD